LIFANWPPLGLFQAQTFGGIYSGELVIHAAPIFLRSSSASGDRGAEPAILLCFCSKKCLGLRH
jgi:hypothetical protein